MTKNKPFFHLHSATMDGCDLTREADIEAQRSWFCSGCNYPKPGTGAIDVYITTTPRKESLTAVVGWGVPIATRAFLNALGDDVVRRNLHIGRVYDHKGREMPGWLTFRGRHRLIIRGSQHVAHRTCGACGRDVYFAMGNPYLYPTPTADVDIFESDLRGMVLTEEIYERIRKSKWPGFYVEKLYVAESPRDGLGELTNA